MADFDPRKMTDEERVAMKELEQAVVQTAFPVVKLFLKAAHDTGNPLAGSVGDFCAMVTLLSMFLRDAAERQGVDTGTRVPTQDPQQSEFAKNAAWLKANRGQARWDGKWVALQAGQPLVGPYDARDTVEKVATSAGWDLTKMTIVRVGAPDYASMLEDPPGGIKPA
jgi:hypothetical protein